MGETLTSRHVVCIECGEPAAPLLLIEDIMIPEFDAEISVEVPTVGEFWLPAEDEVAEDEGINFFRSSMLIYNRDEGEAREALQAERELLKIVNAIAQDRTEYETIAHLLEWPDPDDFEQLAPDLRARIERAGFTEHFDTDVSATWGLDLGVSGIVHTLSYMGFLTAGSCRAHESSSSWSPFPVTYFVSDREHIETLVGYLPRHRCGLWYSESLFGLYSTSVSNFIELAETLVERREEFGPPVFEYADDDQL